MSGPSLPTKPVADLVDWRVRILANKFALGSSYSVLSMCGVLLLFVRSRLLIFRPVHQLLG